jgi:hypothetical protein
LVQIETRSAKSQKLSGQVRETSAQEMLCLTVKPPAQSFGVCLENLHEHMSQLYHVPKLNNNEEQLPPLVVMERWGDDARSPILPKHPALPALFAITPRDRAGGGPIRM